MQSVGTSAPDDEGMQNESAVRLLLERNSVLVETIDDLVCLEWNVLGPIGQLLIRPKPLFWAHRELRMEPRETFNFFLTFHDYFTLNTNNH